MKSQLTLDENLFRIASNIRKWRLINGLKQEQLAALLEISLVSMSKIENGRTDIPLKRLFSIAEALGLRVELLFLDPVTVIKNKNEDPRTTSMTSKLINA